MNIWSDTMEKILKLIVNNTYLFVGILLLLIALFVLLILAIVKVSRPKKIPIYEEDLENADLEDIPEEDVIEKPISKKTHSPKEGKIREIEIPRPTSEEKLAELENRDEEEIKNRIDQEHKEAIKEAMEEIQDTSLSSVLYDLKDAKEISPEEVVRQFEQEQEEQSIISYQELVDVVKNREKSYEDELESRPLATVSDFLPEYPKDKEDKNQGMVELIESLEHGKRLEEPKASIEESSSEEEERLMSQARIAVHEALAKIPEDGRFQRTEVISPVFGRMKEEPLDYSSVKKFQHEELPQSSKNDTILLEAEKSNLREEPTKRRSSEDLDIGNISKNEELLQALKDFRNNL